MRSIYSKDFFVLWVVVTSALYGIVFALAACWFIIYLIAMSVGVAHAHDMSEPNAEWYRSLVVPGTGGSFGGMGHSCCSGGLNQPDEDCKNVDTRQAKDPDGSIHWEAFASSKLFPDSDRSPFYGHAPDAWVKVPDSVIVRGRENPTGAPVGCWFDGKWRCFVEGTAG